MGKVIPRVFSVFVMWDEHRVLVDVAGACPAAFNIRVGDRDIGRVPGDFVRRVAPQNAVLDVRLAA